MNTSIEPTGDRKPKRFKTWHKVAIGIAVAVVLAVTAGPFIYINFIKDDPPPKLSIDDAPVATDSAAATTGATTADTTSETTASADTAAPTETTDATASTAAADDGTGADGTYTVTSDSQVGYRVVEVLFGQDTEGVGRTSSVTGSIIVAGTQVTGDFTVDMTTVQSDESRRDGQFNGRLMETSEFPTATFVITEPIELGSIPADGEEITATATGDLTLHGVTNTVTLEVTAKRTGDSIAIAGSTDIVFTDYDIDDPSTGGISTQNHGLLEFLLVAVR